MVQIDLSHLFEDLRPARADAPAEKHLQSPITVSLLERVRDVIEKCLDEKVRSPTFSSQRALPPYSVRILASILTKQPHMNYSGIEYIVRPVLRDFPGMSRAPPILTPELYPEYLKRTLKIDSELDDVYAEASDLYNTELEAYKSWATLPTITSMIDSLIQKPVTPSKAALRCYAEYRYWDFLVEAYRSRKKTKKFGSPPITIKQTKFFVYNGFLVEQEGDKTVESVKDGVRTLRAPRRCLMTYEQIQMLQDACLARFNAYLALNVGMHNSNPSMELYFTKILEWQEQVLVAYGNDGYELVKGPESMTKTMLTLMSDGDILGKSSFDRTADKMREKERKLRSTPETPLTDKLVSLLTSVPDLDTIVELFGCTKMSGHPIVYASRSAQSVKAEALPVGKILPTAVRDVTYHFIHLVLQKYITKHKVWPVFKKKHEPVIGTKLYELWKSNSIKLLPNSYPLSDLDGVKFEKFMEFDYTPDYLDMIDDKSICPGAQHAAAFWHGNEKGKRRLLDELISRRDVDTKAIVDRMRQGQFHIDERIVELTQKEREFKTAARCFAKLTFEVRMFFVITEANLKRFMGGDTGDNGYMPQQTMTMSNTRLRERLYNLTKNKVRDNTCLIEVDFSRWNLKWRGSTINPIARVLEDIFGLPGVFSQAHAFFDSSTIVLTDKHSCPPGVKKGMHASQWPESDLVWRNHRGGFEGLQQTLWTIGTISMIYYALAEEQVTFQLAGQGDNLVGYLVFQTRLQPISVQLQHLLRALDRRCGYLNHEVKPDECIDSRTVLTYGKEIYVRGVHKLYSLKFSSRAFARLDYTSPSLSKEIASLVSNSISVAGNLYVTPKAILWKHLQVLFFLRRRLASRVYSAEHPSIKRLLKSRASRQALLIPGSLGGLPMMPWTRYFSRGETDDLSFDVAAMHYLTKNVPALKNYMSLLCSGEFTPEEVNVANLLSDPHSIPIEMPNDATGLLSRAIADKLPGIVRNKDIAPLVSTNLDSVGQNYKEQLAKVRPLYPQIMSDLYKLTPAGIREKTLKRFTMTRTIEKIMPGFNFSEKVMKAGALTVNVVLDRLELAQKTIGAQQCSPFETTAKLRSLWKVELDNAHIGLYTPFDFQLSVFTPKLDTIGVSIKPEARITSSVGAAPPNFGTVTKQKTSSKGYKIVNCNSTMRDLKSAALIFSELDGDKSLEPLIDSLIRARSPWSLKQVAPLFPSVYGGTAVHRHAASKHHFGVLGSCSVPTHLTYSSDRAGILSGGEFDYPVAFQTLFLTLANIIQNMDATGSTAGTTSLCYVIPKELRPISVTTPDSIPDIRAPTWPSLVGNKLAYVDTMFSSETYQVPPPDVITHLTSPPPDIDLVFSYLESVVLPKLDGKKIWDGIRDPYDMFDFAEISRISPYAVENAIEWVIAGEVFYDLLNSTSTTNFQLSLKVSLNHLSTLFAGMWIRIRLHTMFHDSEYNIARQIGLDPGDEGHKRAVQNMATLFRRHIREALEARDTSLLPTRILFADWKKDVARVSVKRLILAHVFGTYPSCDSTSLQKCITETSPPRELLHRDPAAFIYRISQITSRKIHGTVYTLPHLPVRYYHLEAQEALRGIRRRDKIKTDFAHIPPKINVSNLGTTKWSITEESGFALPEQTHNVRIPPEDRMRVLRRRKLGKVSPLYSDWKPVLSSVIKRVDVNCTVVHSIGVGRGSVARCLIELGMQVVGYDLISTFPTVSHRSASYIPPEVAQCGLSKKFTWSSHTYETDGNIFDGDLDFNHEIKPTLVVDLDVNLKDLLRGLERINSGARLILRHRGTVDEMKYLIDMLNPHRVICLLVVDKEPRDCVFEVDSFSGVGLANFQRIQFTKVAEITYRCLDNELLEQLINVDSRVSKSLEIALDISLQQVKRLLVQVKSEKRPEQHLSDVWNLLANRETSRPEGKQMRIRSVLMNILEYTDDD